MAAVEMLERGSFKAGPANKCAGCPFAGSCSPCKPGTSEIGKKVLTVNSLAEVPKEFKGIITFNPIPARQGSGESPITPIRTNEKTCSECNKPASTCRHSETSKR